MEDSDRGIINDQSVALICSAALFEELTTGWDAGIEVLNQAFSMVLPGYVSSVIDLLENMRPLR